ncbi:uncharacterized protein LOC108091149 [Drosophila ficusphila]|uniref:uncharacterized protein LOC108091149 n=1 Tax=Drosophila ficusphila TaxID=30025 RepID=UPI0007E771CE|nr:uncharacterized protein LOC108091149 [Drosophila ficusphila]
MENYTLKNMEWDEPAKMELLGQEKDADENCSNPFDVYTDFMVTLVLLYALFKLTELSERYLSQRFVALALNHSGDVRSINREWEDTLQLQEEYKRQLDGEVQELTEKNLGLERMIKELRDCNIHLISRNLMRSVFKEKEQKPAQPNIYINNSYFHLTRQLFVNDNNIDLNVRNSGGMDISPMDPSEDGLNIWMQYLKMRKCYMGPIADPSLIAPNSELLTPVVMTTEQLATLQGII